jgi:hypothetical protein
MDFDGYVEKTWTRKRTRMRVQKMANEYERARMEFVFDERVSCQQGMNAGMSQQRGKACMA